ncbi:MAG: ABC transporter substrate-binding protein, partial [Spirochaetales bacterium]|nr:ABC transporter substrate-binding protein [Candidatus Physcosoma equi]
MKRTLMILMVLLVALFVASAAATKEEPVENGKRTVTDVVGRTVEIPATVTKIVALGSGAPRIAGYLDAFDLFCGIEKADSNGVTILRDYSPVYITEEVMKLPIVGNGGGSGSNNGYPEAIILAEPDVILAGFSSEAADELQKQTGIPVVSVRYTSTGLANESFYASLRVFAETIGKEERGEEVLSFIDSVKKDLLDRTSSIPMEEKPKAYSGAVTFSGRHGFCGTYGAFG